MQYSDLNQPQTITAPTTVRPFSEFQSKLSDVRPGAPGRGLRALGGGAAAAAARAPAAARARARGPSTSVQKYSQCIAEADGDVAKMQKCASLLSSGG